MDLNKELIKKAFPHTEFYPGQEQTLYDVGEYFVKGTKFVSLEAPVGSGKSAIAVAISNYFKEPALITTMTKALQAQYSEELPDAVIAKGASNYYCMAEQSTCDQAVVLTGSFCNNCEYKKIINKVKDPKGLVVANNDLVWYNFQLDQHKFSTVIIDEAHLLESKMTSLLQLTMKKNVLNKFELPIVETEKDYQKFAELFLQKVPEYIEETKKKMLRSNSLTVRQGHASEINSLTNLVTTCTMISLNFTKTPWIVNSLVDGFEIKPVFAGFLTHIVFGPAKRVLLMSGTICDDKQFFFDMKVSKDKSGHISIPSYFPKENRPIIYHPLGRMSAANKRTTITRIGDFINKLMSKMPDIKGIIHTGSFEDVEFYKTNLKQKERLTTHGSGEHERALEEHRAKPGSFLITPSMKEGVNLKDDDARVNIITKIPYPYLGDQQIKARMDMKPPEYNGRKWYNWMTVVTLCQSVGRSTRSPDDYSISIILDESLQDIWKNASNLFPDYIKETMVSSNRYKPSGKLVNIIPMEIFK